MSVVEAVVAWQVRPEPSDKNNGPQPMHQHEHVDVSDVETLHFLIGL